MRYPDVETHQESCNRLNMQALNPKPWTKMYYYAPASLRALIQCQIRDQALWQGVRKIQRVGRIGSYTLPPPGPPDRPYRTHVYHTPCLTVGFRGSQSTPRGQQQPESCNSKRGAHRGDREVLWQSWDVTPGSEL